jgi:glutaredoxin
LFGITVLHRRSSIHMGSSGSSPRVYTLPDCPKCDKLKKWLSDRGVEFDTSDFDTEAQTNFIMRNMFGNPPFLEVGEAAFSSEDLFKDEELDKAKVLEVLNG